MYKCLGKQCKYFDCDSYIDAMTREPIAYCQYQKCSMKNDFENSVVLADRCCFEILNYMFRIGDYVETVDGLTGVIDDICNCTKCDERGFHEPHIKYINGEEDYITIFQLKNIDKCFNWIWKYIFNINRNKLRHQIRNELDMLVECKNRISVTDDEEELSQIYDSITIYAANLFQMGLRQNRTNGEHD